MKDFPGKLQQCMTRGDLTVSDLARWFDRPRATINTWVNGRTPYGPAGRLAFEDLEALQLAIRNRRGFPVPANMSWSKRANYIRGMRNGADRHNRVPSLRPSV